MQLLEEQAEVQSQIDTMNAWALEHTVEAAKQALRVPPDTAEVKSLSGGERRRIALCRLLLEEPDILLLDEPTNHLDAESVQWLEDFLAKYKGTVVAVTHDRYFLDNVAGWILEIDRGRLLPHEGNYSSWLEARTARAGLEDKQSKKQQLMMQAELQWLRKGAKGQQSKGKARAGRYESMAKASEEEAAARKFQAGTIIIPPGPRLGADVIKVEGISAVVPSTLSASGTRQLFKDVSFQVERGDIVGVVGGNGVGKSTLLKIITGLQNPSSGTVTLGETVKLGYVAQGRDGLDGDSTVMDAVSDGTGVISVGDKVMDVRAYLSGFNLHDALSKKQIKLLSGGERNRVHLAKALAEPCNVLLLDEPTNDLDVDTLRSLEEALERFPNCALIVSHDRYFLDRTVSHILAFDKHGKVHYFPGNYTQFNAWALKQAIPLHTTD
jgi:ATP-binding cassette ChvD family protein